VDTRLTPARRQLAAALLGPFPGAGRRRGGIVFGRADLHVHSHWSDGAQSPETRLVPESARQARDIALRGFAVDAAAVRCPMLVIAAEGDRITLPVVVRRVAERYGATLYEYPGFGHMLPLEPRWPEVAADVAAWLGAVETRPQLHDLVINR
jgi:pimeloyl-ACP methyl ester carboxylesterase